MTSPPNKKFEIVFKKSPNQSNRARKVIDTIIIHATEGAFDGAITWMLNPISKRSAHYIISKDGRVVRLVEDQFKAWHAGISSWKGVEDLNQNSIGIELENVHVGKDPYPDEQINRLVSVVKYLKNKFPTIKDELILGHEQIAPGRRHDPGPLFPWDKFRTLLKGE